MLELTVPLEENMEEAYEQKRARYEELKDNCQSRGWRAQCWPVEVGCWGFAGQLFCKAYAALKIIGER